METRSRSIVILRAIRIRNTFTLKEMRTVMKIAVSPRSCCTWQMEMKTRCKMKTGSQGWAQWGRKGQPCKIRQMAGSEEVNTTGQMSRRSFSSWESMAPVLGTMVAIKASGACHKRDLLTNDTCPSARKRNVRAVRAVVLDHLRHKHTLTRSLAQRIARAPTRWNCESRSYWPTRSSKTSSWKTLTGRQPKNLIKDLQWCRKSALLCHLGLVLTCSHTAELCRMPGRPGLVA